MTREEAAFIIAEAERRFKKKRPPPFPKQDAFVNDPSQFVAALCTRRAGKTSGFARRFKLTMDKYPGAMCPYIALTRESAKNIMWPILEEMNDRFDWKAKFTEYDLTMTLENGAKLQLFGADMKNFTRRLRGIKTPGAAVDECFHPDTFVDTPTGPRKIKDIVKGDFVLNALGPSRVSRVMRRAVQKRKIITFNGHRIHCSENHPFFTLRGWVWAKDLRIGDELVSQSFSMRIMQDGLSGEEQAPPLSFLFQELLKEMGVRKSPPEQPHEKSGDKREASSLTYQNGPQATRSRWKRFWSHEARIDGFRSLSRFNSQLSRIAWKADPWISDKLQNRFGMALFKDRHRSRWCESQLNFASTTGPEERNKASVFRVENIESYESGGFNKPKNHFVDLEVEGHPSFSVFGALVHNCQEFHSEHLEDLIDNILTPATADYRDGWIGIGGTPGSIPRGYFHDVTETGKDGYSVHKWSLYDNPYMPDPHGFVERLRIKKAWPANHPTLLREYMGQWVRDPDSLLIRYFENVNHFEELPPLKWNYILGVDIGFNDADALAVIAWSQGTPNIYLVEELTTRGQDISELTREIETMQRKYDISKIVMDEGGLGKKIAEELRRRKHIPVHAAEKQRKMETVAFLNDYLRAGKFKARRDSQFAQDSYQLQIDYEKTTPDRIVVKSGFHSDIIDAAIYAFKESPAFTFQEPKKRAPVGTKAWAEEEEEEMFKMALENARKLDGNDIYS